MEGEAITNKNSYMTKTAEKILCKGSENRASAFYYPGPVFNVKKKILGELRIAHQM